MPIEIKELNIRINVTEGQNQQEPGNKTIDPEQLNDIVSQCVEQVMEIISKNKER